MCAAATGFAMMAVARIILGLAVFAVFVERGVEVASDEGEQASQGATVAYVIARGGQNVVTVVGEIPIATAQLVANAVNFPDDVP